MLKNLKSILLFAVLVQSKTWAQSIEKQDPYLAPLPPATHELAVRIFKHGLKDREALIQEEISATEHILSQCEGVSIRIKVLDSTQLPPSTEQEKTVSFQGSTVYIDKLFLNFLKAFALNRTEGPIDMHLTEFMNADIRKTKVVTGQINYGQSYNMTALNLIFKDPRPAAEQQPRLENVVGNALVLALETVNLHRKDVSRYPPGQVSSARTLSLMAHEMGHLILEAYDPIKNFYGDHWCPTMNDVCPRGHLMSPGGNEDAVYRDEKTKAILGYDSLPKLDSIQCERLKNSKLLRPI